MPWSFRILKALKTGEVCPCQWEKVKSQIFFLENKNLHNIFLDI